MRRLRQMIRGALYGPPEPGTEADRFIHDYAHSPHIWAGSAKRVLCLLCGVLSAGVLIYAFRHKDALAGAVASLRGLKPAGALETGKAIFWGAVLLVLLARGLWRRRFRRRLARRAFPPMSVVDRMNDKNFEHLCADLLTVNGFCDVEVTGKAGDQGVDIIARRGVRRYAVQCKRYSGKVDNGAVQEVYTGARIYGRDTAAVITNSTFTRGAKEAARKCGVKLWDRETMQKMMRRAQK